MSKFVFIGDSILDWLNCARYYPELNILNHGVAGDTISGVLRRLKGVLKNVKVDKILVMIGHNDLCMGSDLNNSLSEFAKICELINQSNISGVYISGLLPIEFVPDEVVTGFNSGVESLCRKNGFKYIPVRHNFLKENGKIDHSLSDGLHLTGAGYDVLAEAFKEYIC